MSDTTKPQEKPGTLAGIAVVVGGVFSTAIGFYCWQYLFIPYGTAFVIGWLASKVAPQRAKPMIPAFAVQSAHALYLLAGLVISERLGLLLSPFQSLAVVDVLILAIGLLWLILRPGFPPVALLSVYQVIGLIVNGVLFASAAIGTELHRALLVHVLLRLTALAFMTIGLRSLTAKQGTTAPPTAARGASVATSAAQDGPRSASE